MVPMLALGMDLDSAFAVSAWVFGVFAANIYTRYAILQYKREYALWQQDIAQQNAHAAVWSRWVHWERGVEA